MNTDTLASPETMNTPSPSTNDTPPAAPKPARKSRRPSQSDKLRKYVAKHYYVAGLGRKLMQEFGVSSPTAYKYITEYRKTLNTSAKTPDAAPSSKPKKDKTGPWAPIQQATQDLVNSPPHYKVGGIETIDFIEAKGLDKNICLANAIKYISRAPFKGEYRSDIEKAVWYLRRELDKIPPAPSK